MKVNESLDNLTKPTAQNILWIATTRFKKESMLSTKKKFHLQFWVCESTYIGIDKMARKMRRTKQDLCRAYIEDVVINNKPFPVFDE